MFSLPSIIAEPHFNTFALQIQLSDEWKNHPAIADIVNVWHAAHRSLTFGSVV